MTEDTQTVAAGQLRAVRHTPGPWYIRTLENFGWNVVRYSNGDKLDIQRVAKCGSEDDARLTSAAPDMFEAIKPFAEAVDNLNDDHPDGSHIWESPAAMSLTAGDLRRALAALTKAQGLSPESEEA